MKPGDVVSIYYPMINRKFIGVFYRNAHDGKSCFVYPLTASRTFKDCVLLNLVKPINCKWLNLKYKLAIETIKEIG